MKRILILLSFCCFAMGCATTTTLRSTPRMVSTSFLDFRPFAKEGFYISQNPYPGECIVLGDILVGITLAKDIRLNGNGIALSTEIEDISGEELLSIIVEKAKEAGGDGLVNFEIGSKGNNDITLSGTVISRKGDLSIVTDSRVTGVEIVPHAEGTPSASSYSLVFGEEEFELPLSPSIDEAKEISKEVLGHILAEIRAGKLEDAQNHYDTFYRWYRSLKIKDDYLKSLLQNVEKQLYN